LINFVLENSLKNKNLEKLGHALGIARKPFVREILGVLISYLFRPKMEILNNFHHKEYIKNFILNIEY